MTPLRHQQAAEDHTCFADGQIEPFENFDYAALDRRLSGHEIDDDPRAIAGDALHEIFRWIWDSNEPAGLKLHLALKRFVVISSLLDPRFTNNQTFSELAEHFGCTKQSLSMIGLQFSDRFAIHFRRQKKAGARANMRAAARGHSQTRFKRNLANPTNGKGALGVGGGLSGVS